MKRIVQWLILALGIGLLPGCIVIPVENRREEVHYHHHASPGGPETTVERVEVRESDLQIQWGESDFSEAISEITEEL